MTTAVDKWPAAARLVAVAAAVHLPTAPTPPQGARPKTSVLRPMISARTARIDDNLGRGTDGSNPLPSSGESDELRTADWPTEQGAGHQAGLSLASAMTFSYLAVRHMLETK